MHENVQKSDKRYAVDKQPYLIMHVAMNRVDPVVVHYLQMSLHAISLRKNVLNNLCMKHHYTKDTLIGKFV